MRSESPYFSFGSAIEKNTREGGSRGEIVQNCGPGEDQDLRLTVVPARRSGARGGLYKLDESHATRWLGFFLFINASSGSFRWIRGSHEPNDPRIGNAAPEGGFSQENILQARFLSSPLFSVPSGAVTDKQPGRSDMLIRIGSPGFGFLLWLFSFCAGVGSRQGLRAPAPALKGPVP